MGCDIHAYIDYDSPKNEDKIDLVNYFGEVNIFRHYALFSLMAGVRGPATLFQAKGLPDRLSWTTRDKAAIYLCEKEDNSVGFCFTRETAERIKARYTDESETRVWNPDFHSHSWLSTDEVFKLIDEYKKIGGECFALNAAAHAMDCLEDLKCLPRLIFWFDN